jgi:crotonyl-CoA carboxylase/reductase
MWKNEHAPGNMAVLVNAPRTGLRTLEDALEAGGGDQREPLPARA